MMKRIFLLLIFLFTIGFVYSEEIVKITEDFLILSKWGPGDQYDGTYMNFNNDSTCQFGWMHDGGDGKYSINNNKLNITGPENWGKSYKNGILYYDKNSLTFEFYIKFDDGTIIYKFDSVSKENKEIIIGSVECISSGYKKGIVLENIKLREKPSIKSDYYKFRIYPHMGAEVEEYNYLPKESKIFILAKTKNKYKVGDIENYWYYIIPDPLNSDFTKNTSRAWVFGEYIDEKEWNVGFKSNHPTIN